MKSLNILRISTDLYPEVLGGGALHAHSMSALQANNGHNVTVLTSNHGNEQLSSKEVREGYEVRRYDELASPFGNSITPMLFKKVEDMFCEADVIHAHSHLYLSTNIAAIISKFKHTPLIVTNHGLLSQSAPNWVNKLHLHTIGKYTFNAADKVLCYTGIDRQRLLNLGVSSDLCVIHNGVDCSQFRPVVPESNPHRLIFVGRLKKSKGVDKIIEALPKVESEIKLDIVGDGPLRQYLENKCETIGIDSKVKFHGRVPNTNLPELYSRSSLFILPSSREGLPRTLLEAMACETPVITSEIPQLKSLVEKAGRTVPRSDTDALASEIDSILQEEDVRKDLKQEARNIVVENYSWNETVRKTTETYFEALRD